MVMGTHGSYNTTICDINVSAICFKRTSLAINVCALSQTGQFFATAYMCHVMKPCQVSCFLGEFSIYWDLKTEILNVSGRQDVCSSFPFLQWDLNMHPMTHVQFSTHFASLEHVLVVQISIMDYIKCLENSINIYIMSKRTLNSFKFQHDTPVILCCL